jgi:hypothetical protein
MFFFEAMLAFANMLDESTTYVSHHCAQMINAVTASDFLIIMIYYASAFIKTRKDKYVH